MDFIIAGLLLMLPVGLIMKQPDLGTSLLVMMAGGAVIFFAGLSWKLVIPPVLLGAVGIGLLIAFEPSLCKPGVDWHVLHEYQRQRVCTLLDPTRDPLGKGFHILQGMIAIGSGGVWGKGFMQGTQTHLEFIPERTTDFIFAAYSEEFGMVGNLALLAAYLFLIFRIFHIAARAPTQFGRLLAGAIGDIFFSYDLLNMGMGSGILPVVGVPLPFISYGGTASCARRCSGICATTKMMPKASSMLRPWSTKRVPWSKPDEYMAVRPMPISSRMARVSRGSKPRNSANADRHSGGRSRTADMGLHYPSSLLCAGDCCTSGAGIGAAAQQGIVTGYIFPLTRILRGA